jgi:hypothetical protein
MKMQSRERKGTGLLWPSSQQAVVLKPKRSNYSLGLILQILQQKRQQRLDIIF